MFDLGTSFAASAARTPDALAFLDGMTRLTYRESLARIAALVRGLDRLGLPHGARLVTLLQNRLEAALLHWACQFAGLVITPVNWRASAADVDFVLEDAEAEALIFEPASAEAVRASTEAARRRRIVIGAEPEGDEIRFDELFLPGPDTPPRRASAEDLSLLFYTSGTTGKPKGVPRRHRAERAAALAHVAQNLYRPGERTLGVMPLYHTMGVRSLLAMSLVGGAFICLPRFDPAAALALIEAERITSLYLVPTLYHDLLHHPDFARRDVSSVRKLGFAGAPMTEGLLRALTAAFRPELFVNHYGSSEIYTFTVEMEAARKPGSAGKAGLNQWIRVVRLGSKDPEALAAPGEEGEIIALAASDEAFEGYWRRPEADAKALREGWYFTGDTGYVDAEGDLFVTGRVDDMIITGGENVSPVEIESVLSLHPAVAEVAVAGRADPRLGQVVTAFIRRRAPVSEAELDAHCLASGLTRFKRPRAYVFVAEIPKSPVGKILRRKLVAGEYRPESDSPSFPATE
jgi:2-furoate---CoA ligase